MTFRGLSFVLRVRAQAVRDYLFGISCASCGAHVRLPAPRWCCGDCLAYDRDEVR